MTDAFIILAGLVVGGLLMVGLIKLSIWMTHRKEASGGDAWHDSAYGNADGYSSWNDSGDCGAGGGGD